MSAPRSIADQVAAELVRVPAMRERRRGLDDRPGVAVAPLLFLLDIALDKAIAATDSGDLGAVLLAFSDLQGFTE